MTQAAKSQEPSMEEILASIRRIIADDDASKAGQRAAVEAPQPAPQPAPVAVAVPRMQEPEPEPEAEPEHEPLRLHDEALEAEPDVEDIHDEQGPDILDLTESMAAPAYSQAAPSPVPMPPPAPAPAPQFRRVEGLSDVGLHDSEPPMPRVEPSYRPEGIDSALLSRATSAAVDSAFNTLAQTVLVQNARTLEDLVREMLRPLLKSWLDDNLPGMVERLVRTEIERVARGR
jgi:uncharacterized protein